MRIFICFLMLFSTLSYGRSTDYQCIVRDYTLDIDMTGDRSTGMFITDRYNYDTIYVGYAGSIDRGSRVSTFYFYGNEGPIKLSFQNKDLQARPQTMRGHIDATLRGFLVVDYFNCKQR